jgi:hypothetical protein
VTASSSRERIRRILENVPRECLRAPVSAAALASLRAWLRSEAALELPIEYEEFLQASDGIQIDNDFDSSADDCRWENETLYQDERYRCHVLLGHEGNVASWAYDAGSRQFVISVFLRPDEVLESYDSLCALIESRLDGCDGNAGR